MSYVGSLRRLREYDDTHEFLEAFNVPGIKIP